MGTERVEDGPDIIMTAVSRLKFLKMDPLIKASLDATSSGRFLDSDPSSRAHSSLQRLWALFCVQAYTAVTPLDPELFECKD